jgi:hypothetical protein
LCELNPTRDRLLREIAQELRPTRPFVTPLRIAQEPTDHVGLRSYQTREGSDTKHRR